MQIKEKTIWDALKAGTVDSESGVQQLLALRDEGADHLAAVYMFHPAARVSTSCVVVT